MNVTFHATPDQPLLLPLVLKEPAQSDTHRAGFYPIGEAHLCHALIQRVAQTHPVVIAEPVGIDDYGSSLEQYLKQGVTRILILPWNLQAATAQLVQQAMHTLHQTGAEIVSASSLLLTRPITVPGVSPVGPLGSLLPPHDRLDRFMEQWPGWRHVYTVVRSEQAAMLILHAGTSHTAQGSDQSLPGNHHRLKQALYTTICQTHGMQEQANNDRTLLRDSTIYIQYLSGMVTAALEALSSLPSIQQG